MIGPKRTPTQDIDFAVAALVEIALRALSPGINDPQTAMTCIDRLTAALAQIMAEAGAAFPGAGCRRRDPPDRQARHLRRR